MNEPHNSRCLNEDEEFWFDMGGELGDVIKFLLEYPQDIPCFRGTCNEKGTLMVCYPKGYLHDGGLTAANGEKYWLWYACDKCNYQTSWHKILTYLSKREKLAEMKE